MKIINKHDVEIEFLIRRQELETRKRISLRKSPALANLAKRKKMEERALYAGVQTKRATRARAAGRMIYLQGNASHFRCECVCARFKIPQSEANFTLNKAPRMCNNLTVRARHSWPPFHKYSGRRSRRCTYY